jgi:hypothetical protein
MSDAARELRTALRRYASGVDRLRLVRRALTAATVELGWLTALAAAFAAFPWAVLPLVWDISIAVGLVLIVALALDSLFVHRCTLADAAAALERQTRLPHSLLAIALQLERGDQPGSACLAQETLRRASESLAVYPPTIDGVYPRRLTPVAAGAALLFAAALGLFTPRIAAYWSLPFALMRESTGSIEPGSVALPLHAGVTLRFRPGSREYPSCHLSLRSLDGEWRSAFTLRPDSSGTFSLRQDSLTRTFAYQFRLGGRAFGPDTITVVPPPALYRLQVSLTPPPYTGQPGRRLPEGQGSFSACAGTSVHIAAGCFFPLRQAWLRLAGADSLALDVSGVSATGTFVVSRSGSYTFSLSDTLGQTNDSLPSFLMEVLPDELPHVQFLRPAANVVLRPEQQESLLVEADDDIAIRRLALAWRTSTDSTVATRELLLGRSLERSVRTLVDWDLTALGLYPGDTVFYWAVAQDNKPFPPPNISSSDTFWLRLPAFDEIHRQLTRNSEDAEAALASVHEQQEKLKQDLTAITTSATGDRPLTFEEKQVLADAEQQIAAQRDTLTNALKELQQAVQSMREDQLADDKLVKKMDEVRKAIEDLVRQYGDSLLFDKKDMAADLSMREMAQAVQKMKQMLPQLGERLEQALQYLQQLRKDQELAALAARFEKMAERQQELASLADSALQRRRQEDVLKGTEQLAGELRQRMDPAGGQPLLSPADAPALDKVDSLAREMRRQQSASPEAGQCRSQMSAAMQETAEQLRSMMASSMMARMQEQRERMLDVVQDALALSEWQRDQSDAAGRQAADPAALVGSQQVLTEALAKATAKLDSLTLVPPRLLQAVVADFDAAAASMHAAERALGSGNALPSMAEASADLNGAAQALLAARDAMMSGQNGQGGAGEGMAGSMRKLSGRQAAINAATGELLRQMLQAGSKPGQGASAGNGGQSLAQMQDAARKAQHALADQLKQLADKYGKEAGGGGEKRMKDLEEEARRLARMLENPSAELRERQDRFLSRMLETSLSIHHEGEGKEKRTSRSAAVIFSPADSGAQNLRSWGTDAFYRLRRRALDANVPLDYRLAVKAYFDSLGVMLLNADQPRGP